MLSDVEKGNNLMLTRLTPVATLVSFRDALSRAQLIKCNGAMPGVLFPGLGFSCLSKFFFLKSGVFKI